MALEKLNGLDDYERFIGRTIESWLPEQRIALAAAMAGRWLPAYESFSVREEWGDPASLSRSLQAVWNHVLGRTLSLKDCRRHTAQVDENTPHLDDFDGPEAIATCAMIDYALNCCGTPDNITHAIMALVSGFEAVAPGIYTFPDEAPADAWHSAEVQGEVAKQLKALEQIGAIAHFDQAKVDALRHDLRKHALIGEVPPQPAPATSSGLTNADILEQYRRTLELDLKGKWHWENNLDSLKGNTGAIISMHVAEWSARYSRRKQIIEGAFGRMKDVLAQRALVMRQQAHDAVEQEVQGWDQETRFWIDVYYQNPLNGLDVTSPESPHGYGPSLRRLCAEAKRRGEPEKEMWKSIMDWGRHRPASWEAEDRRKKKRLAYTSPELSELLARKLSWNATNDVDHPWTTSVAGEEWQVRLNDFPDEIMYSLVISDVVIGDFHDWPECWRRVD